MIKQIILITKINVTNNSILREASFESISGSSVYHPSLYESGSTLVSSAEVVKDRLSTFSAVLLVYCSNLY